MVKISIIIPVYNCEDYLEQCIKSVLAQSLKELEMICIDDGSTDFSAQLLQEFARKDKRIVLLCQENQGPGAARNAGIRQAKGKYIIFLDADDYYVDENALEMMFDACETQNMQVCCSMRMNVEGAGETRKELYPIEMKNKVLFYRDYQEDYFYQNYLFLRELLIQNNIFFPAYRRYQDPPFFVKAMYAADCFVAVDTCLYCYRMSDIHIRFNMQKACDLIKGITDNLIFASEHKLDLLFQNTLERLEYEVAYLIYENISPNDLELLELLMNTNQIVRNYLGNYHYVIRPLRLILFSFTLYEKELLHRIETQDEIALYGAGMITKAFVSYLKERDLLKKVTLIFVSNLTGNESWINGIPVRQLQSYGKEKERFVLVTVGEKIAAEIVTSLEQNGYTNYEVLSDIFGDLLLWQYL
ncbi:MAG: glycosyltransferase family 2 protein [Lachnospiraceae bacterium]|nr:glycosyltransferase family 2 protein [Lachnospiraceae bacterium]